MDDLISRKQAIATADSTDYLGLAIEDVKKVTDEVVKRLKQLPSAQLPDMNVGDMISRKQAVYVASGYCHPANIADELRKLPSAQSEVLAHGVVKCRECKYSAMIYSTNMVQVVGGFEVEGICHIFCQCDKFGGIEMRWDDFCSYAERRNE